MATKAAEQTSTTLVELKASDLRLVAQALTAYADELEKLLKRADKLDQLAARASLQASMDYVTLELRPKFDVQLTLS